MATLSDSLRPAIGIVTHSSTWPSSSVGQAVRLVAHHERDRPVQCHVVVGHAVGDPGGDAPVAGGGQRSSRTVGRAVADHERHVEHRARGGTHRLRHVEVDRALGGEPTGTCGLGRTHQRARVAGVGDLDEHEDQVGGGEHGEAAGPPLDHGEHALAA